jgi:hypothetical protein
MGLEEVNPVKPDPIARLTDMVDLSVFLLEADTHNV